MALILSCSIDLSKISKDKINEKNGAKYYNFSVIVNDEKDKFGNDASITEGQTKEQVAAKEPKKYIGNGKKVWEGKGKTQSKAPVQVSSKADDDLPF